MHLNTNRSLVKVAVIDMNNGAPNQGMRGIQEVLGKYREQHMLNMEYDIFDARCKSEMPDTGYDIYISSGGPGNPYDGENQGWETEYFRLLDDLEAFNATHEQQKKYVFFICHSFQLACRKYGIGKVVKRRSTSFGIFPVHITGAGHSDPVFSGLPDPFYAVDSRDWQVIEPNWAQIEQMGASVLALEKERPHIELERCIMAVRFTNEFIGTQFHPEADATGMKMYLQLEEKKKGIIENHGVEKYNDMLYQLEDPDKIMLTQSLILPNFLDEAIGALQEA